MIIKLIKQFLKYLKASIRELKLVSFPTKKDTFKLGSIVLFTSILFGLTLYFLDWLFQVLRNLLTTINI